MLSRGISYTRSIAMCPKKAEKTGARPCLGQTAFIEILRPDIRQYFQDTGYDL